MIVVAVVVGVAIVVISMHHRSSGYLDSVHEIACPLCNF